MTDEQKTQCHVIIHGAATSAAGVAAAMAQLPGLDNAPLMAIETVMVVSLGKVFGVDVLETTAKGIIMSYLATAVGRGLFQFGVGWIPLLGNAVNAATAFGVVEAMGWAVAADFDNGKNPCVIV